MAQRLPLSFNLEAGHLVPEEWRKLVAQALSSESKMHVEEEAKGRLFSFSFAPIVSEGYVNVYGLDITEPKQAEAALKESEARHRAIAGVIAEVAFSCLKLDGENFAIDWMTGAAEKMFGYSIEEIKKHGCWKFVVDQRDLPIFEERVVGLGVGQSSTCELRTISADGSKKWIKVFSRVEEDQINPKNHRLFGACRDVTERNRIAEALKESEGRLRSIVENSSDQIFMLDRDCRFLLINKVAADLFGVVSQEVVGRSISEVFPEIIADQFSKNIKNVVDTGKSMVTDEKMVIKGRELYNSTSLNPVRNECGSVIAVTGIVRDITERKKAEEELSRSEERYRGLADSLPEIVFETDMDGKLTYANMNAFEISGYTKEDFAKGLCVFDFVEQKDQDKAKEHFKKTLTNKHSIGNEYTFVRKDGSTFPTIIVSKPIVIENQTVGLRGIVVDITQHKKTELSLRESELKFRTLASSSINWVYWVASDGSFIYMSPSAKKITGYTPEEFSKNPKLILQIVDPQDAKANDPHLSSIDSKIEHTSEFRIRTKNGETRWISHFCKSVFDDDGKWRGRRVTTGHH